MLLKSELFIAQSRALIESAKEEVGERHSGCSRNFLDLERSDENEAEELSQ